MNKVRVGVIYPMPKEHGVSIRINRLVSKLPPNFEIEEIVQEKWNYSFFGKVFYLLRQLALINNNEFNPDIIIGVAPLLTGSIPSLYARYLKKVPLIMDWDDSYQNFREHTPSLWEIAYWEYRAVKGADCVVVVSKNLFKNTEYIRRSSKNIYYIPNGVDTSQFDSKRFNRNHIKTKLGMKNKALIITFVSHIGIFNGEFVGAELAKASIELINKHDDLIFLIIGYGDGLQLFKKFVKDNDIEKHYYFTGFVNNKELPKYLSISDICIDAILNMNPKSIQRKPFNLKNRSSMKLKEYMAMKKAAIAGNIGENIIDLDSGKAGILIEHSYKSLASALEILINNENLRKKLGIAARIRVKRHYELKNQAKLLGKIILQFLPTKHLKNIS